MGTHLSWQELFFGFNGRISRKPFWLASILLVVAGTAAMFALGFGIASVGEELVPEELQIVPILVVIAVMLVSSLAISVKRLHDRDKSGWWMALYYGVSAVQAAAEETGYSGTAEDPTEIGIALAVVGLAVAVWYLIDLGILKGTQGPNRYGPDPLAAEAKQRDASF